MRGVLAGLAVVTMAVAGCLDGGLPEPPEAPPETPEGALPDLPLAARNADFGFSLVRELAGRPGENVFVSPHSIATALAMVYMGAGGETREAMAAALRLRGLEPADVAEGHRALREALERPREGVQLRIGNALWADERFEPHVRPQFVDTVRDAFAGEVHVRDFASPDTLGAINAWAEDRTEGMIPRIVEGIEPELVMFLLNAVYFKGRWQAPFDPNATREADFHRADGGTVRVPMMSTEGNFSTGRGDGVRVLRLPYGAGDAAMYVLLPDEGLSPRAVMERLSVASWSALRDNLTEVRGLVVQLPRFRIDYGTERLNDELAALGMGIAFDGQRADLRGIGEVPGQNLYLSFVDHHAVVEVNEEGTEAAAVTIVGVGTTSVPPTFRADRPFVFLIEDAASGTLLFAGIAEDPATG